MRHICFLIKIIVPEQHWNQTCTEWDLCSDDSSQAWPKFLVRTKNPFFFRSLEQNFYDILMIAITFLLQDKSINPQKKWRNVKCVSILKVTSREITTRLYTMRAWQRMWYSSEELGTGGAFLAIRLIQYISYWVPKLTYEGRVDVFLAMASGLYGRFMDEVQTPEGLYLQTALSASQLQYFMANALLQNDRRDLAQEVPKLKTGGSF